MTSFLLLCLIAVQCPALQELQNGVVSCGDDEDTRFSYGNSCNLSCAPGYQLVGESMVSCTSAAEWTDRMPHCEGMARPIITFSIISKRVDFLF